MNVALQNYITTIESKYNTCDLGGNPNINKRLIDNAVILHWNGVRKPWKSDGLYKEYYII